MVAPPTSPRDPPICSTPHNTEIGMSRFCILRECRRFKLRSSCLHRYSSYPLSYLLSTQKVTPTSKSRASTWLLDVVRQNRRPTVAGTLAPDWASAYSPDNLYLVHDVNLEHLTLSHLVHQFKPSLLTTLYIHLETQRWCGPFPHLLLKKKAGELHLDGIKFPKDLPKGGKPTEQLCNFTKKTEQKHFRHLSARSIWLWKPALYLQLLHCTKCDLSCLYLLPIWWGGGRGRRKFPVPFLTRWVTISKHQSIPESEWSKKRKRLQGLPPRAFLRTMENQEPLSCWLHFPTPPHTGTHSMWTTDHNQAQELTTQFFCFPKYEQH